MKKSCEVLAADLGAGSGKVFSVRFDGERIKSEELHRFPNSPLMIRGRLHNNVGYLYDQIRQGFLQAGKRGGQVQSAGIDTFGNDFGLLNSRDELIGLPYNYRDSRTKNYKKLLEGSILENAKYHYDLTGISAVDTTAYNQLLAAASVMRPEEIAQVSAFMMLPDLFGFFLTGDKACEYVITATSDMVDVRTKDWSFPVLGTLPFSRDIFLPIIMPGTQGGVINDPEMDFFRRNRVRLIKGVSHDSGCAALSVPGLDDDSFYICSGSLSLLGFEAPAPMINEITYGHQYNNHRNPEGKFRIQKNVPGLWVLQQCLKEWKYEDPGLTFGGIDQLAEKQEGFRSYIDVDQPEFSSPGNMPEKIRHYCRLTGQAVPDSIGAAARCIYESIVIKYKSTIAELEALSGRKRSRIYIVGGGANALLMASMVASATSKTVLAGMQDAPAMGNALVQLIALGYLADIRQAREIAGNSFAFARFEPDDGEMWDRAFAHASRVEQNYAQRLA